MSDTGKPDLETTSMHDPETPTTREATEGLVLVVAWCEGEAHRVGEVLAVPASLGPGVAEFGRGSTPQSSATRLELVRQRPGERQGVGSPAIRGLSRRQFVLRRKRSGALAIDNTGRCPMRVDGQACASATLSEADVVELGRHLVFVCVRRPPELPLLRDLRLDPPPFGRPDAFGWVGESPAAWRLRDQVAFVACRQGHVLVVGESGTGKELVARAIHALSDRAERPMVARNAATLPEGLVDAELFGNAESYPNPGMKARPGLVGQADRSTLFLDEIGELPHALQAHLLRVLDRDGEYHRLGETTSRRSDLRLVAATNRSIAALKHDFAARFKLRIEVPTLTERREDIPLLAFALLRKIAEDDAVLRERFFAGADDGTLVPRLDADLMAALLRHEYTLHVRELETLLWRALSTSPDDRIALTRQVRDELNVPERETAEFVRPDDLDPARVQAVLDANDGVQERAWRELGLKNRYALLRFIRKHGLRTDPKT